MLQMPSIKNNILFRYNNHLTPKISLIGDFFLANSNNFENINNACNENIIIIYEINPNN